VAERECFHVNFRGGVNTRLLGLTVSGKPVSIVLIILLLLPIRSFFRVGEVICRPLTILDGMHHTG
jgi:hypothetical protein